MSLSPIIKRVSPKLPTDTSSAKLDAKATQINEEMKIAASYAIASLVSDEELNEEYILPAAFDERVGKTVAKAVYEAAIKTGVSRIK